MSAPPASPDLARLLEHAGIEDGGASVLAWARERSRELIDAASDDLLARIREGTAPPSSSLPPVPASEGGAGVEARGAEEDVEEIEELEDVEILDDEDLELIEEDDAGGAEETSPDSAPSPADAHSMDEEAERSETRSAAEASEGSTDGPAAASEQDDEEGDLFDEDELDLDLSGL